MKTGDIVFFYPNPVTCEGKGEQCRLVKKIANHSKLLEEWTVEFINQPERFYNVLLRKNEN